MLVALYTLIDGLKRATQRIPNASRLAILQVIAARPGIHPSEIAQELGMSASSSTRQIQELEREGRVTLARDQRDRRACVITLTESGQEKLAELTQIGLNRFLSFVADWDAEEVRILTRLLVKLEESKAEVGRRDPAPTRPTWREGTDKNA